MTRWENELYVKLYKNPSPTFLSMSIGARGLFDELLKVVDRLGTLKADRLGLKAIAVAVRAPWSEIDGWVRELLEDGCVVYDELRGIILIPNYYDAQNAAQSDKARKQKSRQIARARLDFPGEVSASRRPVTKRDTYGTGPLDVSADVPPEITPPVVTERDQPIESRESESQYVTNATRLVTNRTEEKRRDPPLPPTPSSGVEDRLPPEAESAAREDAEAERGRSTPLQRGGAAFVVATEAFAEAVGAVTESGFAWTPLGQIHFVQAVNGHAPSGLHGRELEARVRFSAGRFARERHDKGWKISPDTWLEWLNSGNGWTLAKPVAEKPKAKPKAAVVLAPVGKAPLSLAEVAAAAERGLGELLGAPAAPAPSVEDAAPETPHA